MFPTAVNATEGRDLVDERENFSFYRVQPELAGSLGEELDGHECVGSESHQQRDVRWDRDSKLRPKTMSQKSRKLPSCLGGQDRVSLLCPH